MKLLILLTLFSFTTFAQEEVHADRASREISIIVGEHGYYPEKLTVFKGERLKVYVTSTSSNPSCVIFDEHKLFLSARKGSITEGEVVVKNSGTFDIFCPSSKFKSKLIVLVKPSDKKGREVASKPTYWMPREY